MPKVRNGVKSLWRGPEIDGITQSLLSRFLVDRERFRLLVVDGLTLADSFNHRIEYGNLWHTCQEAHAKRPGDDAFWTNALLDYARALAKRYRESGDAILHWMRVCGVQFREYLKWRSAHDKGQAITTLAQERTFAVPYHLPSGRVPILRGKWDGVKLIGKNRPTAFVQENKTKGDIVEEQMRKQLHFDLQTMLYFVALLEHDAQNECPIVPRKHGKPAGVIYDVVRRPLSGGKGTIRKHQPTKSNPKGESDEEFYGRLGGVIREDPGYFFMEWLVVIHDDDVLRFKREFLTPCLEALCNWWDWVSTAKDPFSQGQMHWRTPYGVYNPLAEGAATDLDEYLATGSTVGLQKATTLFPELE